jgi:hypothetical protein
MSNLISLLDAVAFDVAKDNPALSEAEVALVVTKMNLTVLALSLSTAYVQGYGLNSEGLYVLTSGLIETAEWLAGKEMMATTMPKIESMLRGEV